MNLDLRFASVLLVAASLARLVVIAMLLERALAFLFEYYWFRLATQKLHGLRAALAIALSTLVCFLYQFDIFGDLVHPSDGPHAGTNAGIVLTSMVVAGCSVGFIALLQGLFDWSKLSRDELIRARQMTSAAVAKEALARAIAAQALVAEAETRRLRAEGELAESRAASASIPGR
jgi:hypothetical protein